MHHPRETCGVEEGVSSMTWRERGASAVLRAPAPEWSLGPIVMPVTLDQLRAASPPTGLFAEKSFLLSPEPLRLESRLADELGKLGHRLQLFQRAANELYYRSLA